MESSSGHESTSAKAADSKIEEVGPIIEGSSDAHDETAEPIAAELREEGEEKPTTSTEDFADGIEQLSMGKDASQVGASEPTSSTSESVVATKGAEQDHHEESVDTNEEAETVKRPAKSIQPEEEGSTEDSTSQESAAPTTEAPEASTSASAVLADSKQADEEHDPEQLKSSAPQTDALADAIPESQETAAAALSSSATDPSESAPNTDHSHEEQVEDTTSPPTPPSKDAPQPPEKSFLTQSTSTTTATAQKQNETERKALADPESVAAVAHAFGRDSPALRSSMDTPKRVSMPLEISRSSEATENKDEKAALKDAEEAEGSSKVAASEPAQGSAAPTTSDPEKRQDAEQGSESPRGGIRIGKGPPPSTQAREELPFDFNRFLEQMKHRSAQPVGEYVRSFIKSFAKKPYRTQDQIKLIFDFLEFIAARMRECDVWRNLSETEFENAKEAMEKLVMNRLYPYTFTPAVQKEGRFAVQTDDLERDRVLRQRIVLFGWLSEEHLDVPVGDHSRGFIEFSIQELLKINHYKAPRDKLICILNCCKVIFGMIRHLSTQENADTFIPVLIFVVLKANPEHLISNVEYISRFRNPERLSSESGYYLSSLMGAIAFIETMDYTSLSNITQEEFEKRVEAAVSSLPEPEPSTAGRSSMLAPPTTPPPRGASLGQGQQGNPEHQRSVSATSVSAPSGPGEEAARALPFTPMAASLADDTRAFFLRTGEAARTGLSRPMGALGRLINEGIEGIRTPSSSNHDSGASTERHNSPAPPADSGSAGMTASTSRSKLFGGLFGSLDTSDQARNAGYPGQQAGRRSLMVDDEPQTPSTGEMLQEGFQPYNVGGAPNAPNRILRPNVPQRNYSIDDTMFDDESAGRRNLMTTSAGARGGAGDGDYYDYEDDDDDDLAASRPAPNAAARRRMQMQQDFGLSSTPSRHTQDQQGRLQAGPRDPVALENAQTDEAIHRSLLDQQRTQVDAAAQNSASLETLKSIFPTMDEGVIQMVLQGCDANVETAIDRLLEMQ